MSERPLLEVKGLGKRYPQGYELQPTSFALFPGTINAVLGANGAGKSTLFQLLSANSHATSGSISFLDTVLVPEQFLAKRSIGYLPQNLQLPPWITGLAPLRYTASLYRLPNALARVDTMLDYWDCRSSARLALTACSHGMQKRIALAMTFLHDPPLAILDEPFSGLDLYHIKALEEEISRRKTTGKVTILSTHIIPYVVELCDTVAALKGGQFHQISSWQTMTSEEKSRAIHHFFF